MRGKENQAATIAGTKARAGVLAEKTQVTRLENENFELKVRIRAMEKKLAEKQAPNASMQHESAHVPQQGPSTNLVQENERLKQELAAVRAALDDMKRGSNAQQDKLIERVKDHYQKEIDEYFGQVREKLKEKKHMETRIRELEATIAEVQRPGELEVMARELQTTRKRALKAENSVKELELRLRREQELRQREHESRDRDSRPSSQRPTSARFARPDSQTSANSEAAALRSRVQSLQSELEAARRDAQMKAEEAQRAQAEAREAQRQATKRQANTEEAETLQSTIRRLELQLTSARSALDSAIDPATLAEARAKASEAQAKVAELEGQNAVLENEVRRVYLNHEILERQIADLKSKDSQTRDLDIRANNEKTRMATQIQTLKARKVQLEDETKALTTQLDRENRARKSAMQRVEELEKALVRHDERPNRELKEMKERLSQVHEKLLLSEQTHVIAMDELRRQANDAHYRELEEVTTSHRTEMADLARRLGLQGEE